MNKTFFEIVVYPQEDEYFNKWICILTAFHIISIIGVLVITQ